jgi:hypothetical protein
MTPAQKREVQRFTRNMWCLLDYAAKIDPAVAAIGGSFMQAAKILERRGSCP